MIFGLYLMYIDDKIIKSNRKVIRMKRKVNIYDILIEEDYLMKQQLK